MGGFIYSMWLSKKDASTKTKNAASPIVRILEIFLGILGIVAAVTKTLADLQGGE